MATRKKAAVKPPAKKYAVLYDTDLDTYDTLQAAKDKARSWTQGGNGESAVVEVLVYFRTTSGVREEAP